MSIAKRLFVLIYALIIIVATIIMFTYTSFSNSSLGKVTIIGLNKKLDNYANGDLLIAKKSKIHKNDEILFYDVINGKAVLSKDTITRVMNTNKNEITYVVKNNKFISSSYVVSNSKNTYAIPLLGYVYLFLANKYVYLISIITPVLVNFIYQIRKKNNA